MKKAGRLVLLHLALSYLCWSVTTAHSDEGKNESISSPSSLRRRNRAAKSAAATRNLQDGECAPLPTDKYIQIINRETRLAMHVAGRSNATGAAVIQEYQDDGTHDNWRLISSGFGGYYHIIAQHSGLALAVEGSSKAGDAPIVQETFAQTNNQDWCFIPVGTAPGHYIIRNRNSGLAIHGKSQPNGDEGGERDGNPIFQTWYWGGQMQEWRIDIEGPASPAPKTAAECVGFPINTFVHIEARHSGKAIGVDPAQIAVDGAAVIQNPASPGAHDNWSFKASGNGFYHVFNQASGLALSLEGRNVVQKPANATGSVDDWCFVLVGEGYYAVINEQTGAGLDVPHWSKEDGAAIVTWGYQGGVNQQFKIGLAADGGTVTTEEPPTPTLPPQTGNPNAIAPWDGPHAVPLVAVAIANLPNGKILMWSAVMRDLFAFDTAKTWTAIYDPETEDITEKLVENTNHDMFCPGTAGLSDGTIMITGGSNATATTLYNPSTNSWTVGAKMIVPRGYHAMTTLADGSVFTIGGSWHGSVGGKGGEIWHPFTNKWRLLANVPVTSILTKDLGGEYRSDNHAWLFTAPNGMVFHAGPSSQMNWIDVRNQGAVIPAGIRETSDRMNGNALMIGNGIIFVVGGAPNYDTGDGTKNAFLININNPSRVTVKKVGDLNFARTLSNSCVLPSGEVVVTGGQSQTLLFTDDFAVLQTEIYNPRNQTFSLLASMHVPRTYHAVSILMKDGRVMVAGGGLCGGCPGSHRDYEVLTPPYLLDSTGALATRPVIISAPKFVKAGELITIQMDTAQRHSFALIRTSSSTHNVNNDQRRIPLFIRSQAGSSFGVRIPSNVNIALTGVYYLFAMNSNGVPSMAVDLQISAAKFVAPTPAPTLPPVPVVPYSDNGSWIMMNDNATIDARHENCFAMVENSVVGRKAYLAGGRGWKALNIFDPISRTWTTGAPPPTFFHHTQCVAAQGKLWVVAAWTDWFPKETNIPSTLVYDPAVNKWSTLAGMPPSRQRGGAAIVVSADEKTIYVSHGTTGGHETDNHAQTLPYLDAYDIASNTWTALSDNAPNPRDHCAGAMINGRICVVGGRNGGLVGWPAVNPTDCYNLATGAWEVEAPIPVPRAGMAYTQTCDGRLMIAGGEGGGKAHNTVEIFDGESWKTLKPLNTTRHGTGIARDCRCNQLHIASGAGNAGSEPELKSIETYFPDGVISRCTTRS